MNRKQIYNKINTLIIENLKKGVVPWKKPWREGLPMNLASKKVYNGINFYHYV